MHRPPHKRNLLAGFIISLCFIAFLVIYSFANMRIVLHEKKKEDASLQSLRVLEDLLDDMQDIESGQRGFIISHQAEYLDPYYRGLADYSKDTQALKAIYPRYPERTAIFNRLMELSIRKKNLAAENIRLTEMGVPDSTLVTMRSGQGRKIMDSIRLIIAGLDAEDHIILRKASEKRLNAARAMAGVFVGMSLLFVTGLIIVYTRIRRNTRTRENYERQIAYLAGLSEKTSDAIFSTDSTGRIRSWNNGAREMYGFTAEQAIGKKPEELLRISPDSAQEEKRNSELRETGHTIGEYGAFRSSAEIVIVQASVSQLKDEKGNPEGLVHVHRDITERKKSENFLQRFNEELAQQVEEKTQQLNHIVDRLKDGFYSLDEELRFNFVNESVYEITGIPAKDMIGKKMTDVFPETVSMDFYANLQHAFREQVYINEELYYEPLKKWFVVHIYPSENGLTVFSRDITPVKKAEEKLRSSNERFEMITRTTNDAVWEWNLETGELWGNDTHQQLYGLDPDDPVPSEEEWLSRIHPDDRPGMIHKQARALSSEANVFITEYRFNTVARGYRDIYDRCYIVRNAEGKAVRILGSMMDITERKQTELALQQSEEKYRSMIEQASDGIFIMDGEGNYVDTNTAACNLVGYTREEMKNMSAVDLLPEGVLPVPKIKKEELQAGQTVILDRLLRKKNGETIDTEVSYKMLSNGNILAIARNVTEKKRAEEELRRSNERFQLLSKATSDIVWDWDIQEDTIWWNDNYYSLLGLSKKMEKEPIEEWYKRIHPDDLQRVRKDVEEGIRSGISYYSHEYRFAKADGQYLHFLDRTFILWGADKKPHRMIGSMVNMTPIYEAQRVLAESENRLRTIINSEPQCIKLLNRNGQLLDMNPAGLAMIEADNLEQVKGKNVLGLVDKAYQTGFSRLLKDIYQGKSGSLLFRITGLKGTSRWMETHAVPMKDAAGNIIALLGVSLDVTDKRKAEEELEQSYKAIRKLTGHIQNVREQERGHIAREIHDELGQQLTVLKMDVSWLNKRLGHSDEAIRQKMKALLAMLDETVRSVRRISSELRPSLLDDLGLVAAMEWQLAEFEKRSGIHTRYHGSGEEIRLPESVKTALFRIFQESLTNVARHSYAKSVSVQLVQENEDLVLCIEDDGKGFDPQQVAEKRTLGILGMKERTLMMGGTYDILSHPGMGTTVTVKIPYNQFKPTLA